MDVTRRRRKIKRGWLLYWPLCRGNWVRVGEDWRKKREMSFVKGRGWLKAD